MKVQFDIEPELMKRIDILKIEKELKTKPKTILYILKDYFDYSSSKEELDSNIKEAEEEIVTNLSKEELFDLPKPVEDEEIKNTNFDENGMHTENI